MPLCNINVLTNKNRMYVLQNAEHQENKINNVETKRKINETSTIK